jgi:hypothetical protein
VVKALKDGVVVINATLTSSLQEVGVIKLAVSWELSRAGSLDLKQLWLAIFLCLTPHLELHASANYPFTAYNMWFL